MEKHKDMIKDLIDKHDSVCSKIEELSRKNRVSPPIPQPKVYSRIEKKLLCTCVAIQTQESLFFAEDSFEEIKLASTIKRFFSTLFNYLDEQGQGVGLIQVLWLDAILKMKHDRILKQFQEEDFGEPDSNEKLFSRHRYRYPRLLAYRDHLCSPMKAWRIDSANSLIHFYHNEEVFPLLIFAQLIEPTVSLKWVLSTDNDGTQQKEKYIRIINFIKERHFFREAAKKRDFERTLNAMRLMGKCLQKASYSENGKDIQKPNYDIHLPKFSDLEKIAPVLREKIIDSSINLDEIDLTPDDIVEHAALNLYVFNETTQMLDWVFAARAQSLAVLNLENMLFSKWALSSFSWPDDFLQTTVFNTYLMVFRNLYAIMEHMSDDVLETHYMQNFNKSSVLDITTELVEALETFHYYEGQGILLSREDTGKEERSKTLYRKMAEIANRNSRQKD